VISRRSAFPIKEPENIEIASHLPSAGWILDKNDVEGYQETNGIDVMVNYKESFGNFITDSDGNHLLDLSGTLYNPLGYNHPDLVKAIDSKDFDTYLHNGTWNCSDHPNSAYANLVNETLVPLKPANAPYATLTNNDQAVETAVRLALSIQKEKTGSDVKLVAVGSVSGSHWF